MLSDDLTQLDDEAAAHKSAQAAAAKVSDLAALEDVHLSKVTANIEDMKAMCHDIGETCMDDHGKMANASAMSDVAAQMKQECINHQAAMAAAVDLASANTEEARHQDVLSDLRGKVKDGIERLTPGADDYHCSTSGHSH